MKVLTAWNRRDRRKRFADGSAHYGLRGRSGGLQAMRAFLLRAYSGVSVNSRCFARYFSSVPFSSRKAT